MFSKWKTETHEEAFQTKIGHSIKESWTVHDTPGNQSRTKKAGSHMWKFRIGGKTGQPEFEHDVTFQIYLERKGSYKACDDYDRQEVVTDKAVYLLRE